jgi:hypothetical protein
MTRGGWAAIAFAVAATAGAPCHAAAAGANEARAFMEQLYAKYGDPSFCPTCDGKGRFFDAPLSRLIDADARQANGEVGALDGDPVCQCQDPGGMKAKVLSVALTSAYAAVATVDLDFTLEKPPQKRRVTFDLVVENGHWRIHDIHSSDTPSLRALLQPTSH